MIDAAVLVAVGPLAVLDVLALAAEHARERVGRVGADSPPPASAGPGRRVGRSATVELDVELVRAAADLELDLVAGLLVAESLQELG